MVQYIDRKSLIANSPSSKEIIKIAINHIMLKGVNDQ